VSCEIDRDIECEDLENVQTFRFFMECPLVRKGKGVLMRQFNFTVLAIFFFTELQNLVFIDR